MFKTCLLIALTMTACTTLPAESKDDTADTSGALADEAVDLCEGMPLTLPVSDAGEAVQVFTWGMPIAEIGYLGDAVLGAAEYLVDSPDAGGCLTVSTDDESGATLIEADCEDIDGITLTGSMSWLNTDTGYALSATALHMDDGNTVLSMDGTSTLFTDSTRLTFEADISIADTIGDDPPSDRELIGFGSSDDEGSLWYGWISVAAGLGDNTGGSCFSVTESFGDDSTCGTDTQVLVGANTAVLTSDPDTCDGCFDVTIDGETVDPWCR